MHTSFQVRMPYIKGVLHKVDFKSFLAEMGVSQIKDMWGVFHSVEDVDIILTKSMFKGCGWMEQNGLSWAAYLERCRRYHHALYISEVSQVKTDAETQLNYQFLVTASIQPDEFRPADLPLGWKTTPFEEKRDWITKATEQQYYSLVGDADYRLSFLKENNVKWKNILALNPRFADEAHFTKQLDNQAKKILQQYAFGRLIAAGDNRYLSDDLLHLLKHLVNTSSDVGTVTLEYELLREGEFYAPCAQYPQNDKYVLLRNPHIARNEEAVAKPIHEVGYFRKKYLSHLNYVIMVASSTLIPERLGGADFDGDMIKTIAAPLINNCVARNYASEGSFDAFSQQYPVLKIPSVTPLERDANDWRARMETVKNTFNARIGQICNAAFDRSIVAYDESRSEEERRACREETELLEILTGLEIDSAKSGVKPDLSEYLTHKTAERSRFLKYKSIAADESTKQWFEETKKKKLDKFFAETDWNAVTANVEKLPYFALMLEKNTPKQKPKPASDEELFPFAKFKDWKKQLNQSDLELIQAVIADYEQALRHIRISRLSAEEMKRHSDVERILFARGQENEYTADELYGLFSSVTSDRISSLRRKLSEEQFHLMPYEKRIDFLQNAMMPDAYAAFDYIKLLADFRCNGYRILGDIICDYDDKYMAQRQKERALRSDTKSELLNAIMRLYQSDTGRDYTRLAARCVKRYIRDKGIPAGTALRCAVALGKRQFAYDVFLAELEKELKEEKDAQRKRRISRLHK